MSNFGIRKCEGEKVRYRRPHYEVQSHHQAYFHLAVCPLGLCFPFFWNTLFGGKLTFWQEPCVSTIARKYIAGLLPCQCATIRSVPQSAKSPPHHPSIRINPSHHCWRLPEQMMLQKTTGPLPRSLPSQSWHNSKRHLSATLLWWTQIHLRGGGKCRISLHNKDQMYKAERFLAEKALHRLKWKVSIPSFRIQRDPHFLFAYFLEKPRKPLKRWLN